MYIYDVLGRSSAFLTISAQTRKNAKNHQISQNENPPVADRVDGYKSLREKIFFPCDDNFGREFWTGILCFKVFTQEYFSKIFFEKLFLKKHSEKFQKLNWKKILQGNSNISRCDCGPDLRLLKKCLNSEGR